MMGLWAVLSAASTTVPVTGCRAPLVSAASLVTLRVPALVIVVSASTMSLPVALVRTMAVPAVFRLAMTPVLDDFSLMAEMALDRPSALLVEEIEKDNDSGVRLSDRMVMA